MSLKEKLISLQRGALEEKALAFSEEIQSQLEKAAENGESELLVLLKKEDKAFNEPYFIEVVNELLDGVDVRIIEQSNSLALFSAVQKYICLSWA